jgi:TonB family protein
MPLSRNLIVVGLMFFSALGLNAQHSLYVEYKGKGHLVRAARDSQPCIELNGKLQPVKATRIQLKAASSYLPLFVTINDMKAKSFQIDAVDLGQSFNHELQFSAVFESAYHMENVYLLLDLETEEVGKGYFIYEIGRLTPYKPYAMNVRAPLRHSLGAGQFKLHLFTDGAELLQSTMPAEFRERILNGMIAQRIAKLQDTGPQPFIGPAPKFPAKLKQSKTPGSAVVAFVVTKEGALTDPVIVKATTPEFGEAAIAAARLWRFLPAVRDRQPVAERAELAFQFALPNKN